MQDIATRILLNRMDEAFGDYSQQAERLSALLAKPMGASSWTLYHDLQRQRTAETVAYEKYRKLQDELFAHIAPPAVPRRPESSVA
ncbi:MAG: hypothetical protein WA581_14855 [Candidatus Acidiferrales bacterium]